MSKKEFILIINDKNLFIIKNDAEIKKDTN